MTSAPATLWILLACGPKPSEPSTPSPAAPPAQPSTEDAVIETIDETTVGDLDGVRVPMGNVTHGSYTLPDGREAEGPICSLALPGQTGVFVGEGSVVEVEGTRWEVLSVEAPKGELGSVTLKKLD